MWFQKLGVRPGSFFLIKIDTFKVAEMINERNKHMKFGFIGAGNVAQTYAKHFARHGHEVVLSNSRGPDSLVEIVRGIGPNVKAGTVK